MWICNNCSEQSEDHFVICWNCQFDRDGVPQIRPEEDSTEARGVLDPFLKQNESLKHWAYGIEPMPIELKLFLFVLGVLFTILVSVSIQVLFLQESFPHFVGGQEGKPPAILTITLVGVMSYLFYAILGTLMTKNCVLGLTDQRLVALICKNKFQIEKVLEYRLNDLPVVMTAIGAERSLIEICDWQHPLSAVFIRADQPNNFEQAVEITNQLSKAKSRQGSCRQAVSFCPMCRAEFRAGFTHCNNCHINLVEYAE